MTRATRFLALLLALALLAGCAPQSGNRTVTWYGLFDTVITLSSRTAGEAEFQQTGQAVYARLEQLHRLFDIYHDYDGMNNLKTVNDQAGIAPVSVDGVVLEMLQSCRDYEKLTGGVVNVAMGSVLQLWHQAREAALEDPASAAIPDSQALAQAAAHTDPENMILDFQAGTVYLADAQMRLDVGAIAKGWAAQNAAQLLPEGYLLSVGGNVCASGPKQTPDTPWTIGIRNPDGDGYLRTVAITGGCVVTSGDYERVFTVDGVSYCHIIDPETLMPARRWRSVTVICDDSALADALSTALFILPQEQGQALLDQVNAHALWLTPQGQLHASPNFPTG